MATVTAADATEGAIFGIQNSDLRDGTQATPHDLKFGFIELADTTDAGDTVAVDMWTQFGMKKLLGIMSWKHTTNESVIVTEANTCTVSQETVTVTVVAGSDNDKRIIMLVGV